MSPPPVSVVIPLYNKRRTIRRAIASVLAQTWRDFELIVVDDGSTDGGAELAAACDDPRLRLIRQANAGPGAARNRGAAESQAEYLAFLDADDEWLPKYLQTSVKALQQHPKCGLAVSIGVFLPQQTAPVPTANMKTGPWRMSPHLAGYEARNAIQFLHAGTIVCRKPVFNRYGGFYEHGSNYGEDTYLSAQLTFGESVYRIAEPLVWFHREDSSLGYGRKSDRPVPPLITDPGRLYSTCAGDYQKLLSRFLTYYACRSARDTALRGETDAARLILSQVVIASALEPQTRRYLREAKQLIFLRMAMRHTLARKIYRRLSRLCPTGDQMCIPSH